MNPIYNMWDYNYIQQQAQQYHQTQVMQVQDSTRKLGRVHIRASTARAKETKVKKMTSSLS